MASGLSIKFEEYPKSVSTILKLIKLDVELKKHNRIIIKPNLMSGSAENSTKIDFIRPILGFCLKHKNPDAELLLAEGSDGHDSMDVFHSLGFASLAESFGVSLLDLNKAETQEIHNHAFIGLKSINYPSILLDSFVISVSHLREDPELLVSASLDNMLGAFPARHYKTFFSKSKNKLKQFPLKYQVHDIIQCKSPDLAIIDCSEQGYILAGKPFEMDVQAAKLIGLDWKNVPHLRLINETASHSKPKETQAQESEQEKVK